MGQGVPLDNGHVVPGGQRHGTTDQDASGGVISERCRCATVDQGATGEGRHPTQSFGGG
jgi:hypothetical protein